VACDVTMSSSDDDVPLALVKKKKIKIRVKPDHAASSSSSTVDKKRKHDSSASSSSKSAAKKVKTEDGASAGSSKSKALKKLDKAERLQYAMQSFLWWNSKEPPPGCQWLTMEHAGVSFPEPYMPHGIKMRYEGEPINLTSLQEEA
jgi:DNA topoisomerase I